LAQRLQDLARPAGSTVVSEATVNAIDAQHDSASLEWESLGACEVKGRSAPVVAYRLTSASPEALINKPVEATQ
ncbi:MAG: hypothetical protein ABIM89_04595, partial [Mycobacteriales bacterium]